jgi:hypothetical protein
MDPELQKQLNEMLKALLANAQDAATWAKAEIPLLVREKIAFGRAWETAQFVVLLGLLAVVWRIVYPHWKAYDFKTGRRPSDDTKEMTFTFFLVAPSVVIGICAYFAAQHMFLVWFAPRLYIVQWLLEMVKTVKS